MKNQKPKFSFQLSQRLKKMRPMFFVSSTNTSDCSEVDENYRDRCSKIFESTPYRKTHSRSNIVKTQEQIDDVLSNISSSSPEPSFDTKEILRQVKTSFQRTFFAFISAYRRLPLNRSRNLIQTAQWVIMKMKKKKKIV